MQQLDALGFHVTSAVPTRSIEAHGFTKLDQIGNYYYLDPLLSVGGGAGPVLNIRMTNSVIRVPVDASQMGGLSPIAAEEIGSALYEVVWKADGVDQYTVWNVDGGGSYRSTFLDSVSGSDISLQSLETSFFQDLNGDGFIGVAPTSVVEAFGSTELDRAINDVYYLNSIGGGAGPSLAFGGAAVDVSTYGGWVPIGAEKLANGNYEVAWNLTGTDSFVIWTTFNNGNYISDGGVLSRGSLALESAETSFQQDLNGDGVIGATPTTTVEAFGSTKLDQDGNIFFLDPVNGGAGPSFEAQRFAGEYERLGVVAHRRGENGERKL